MTTQTTTTTTRCPVCGMRERTYVSAESRRRDVSEDTWALTTKGAAPAAPAQSALHHGGRPRHTLRICGHPMDASRDRAPCQACLDEMHADYAARDAARRRRAQLEEREQELDGWRACVRWDA